MDKALSAFSEENQVEADQIRVLEFSVVRSTLSLNDQQTDELLPQFETQGLMSGNLPCDYTIDLSGDITTKLSQAVLLFANLPPQSPVPDVQLSHIFILVTPELVIPSLLLGVITRHS
jgi:hypothetical protein